MECGQCGYQSGNDALFCGKCSNPLLDLNNSNQLTADIIDVNLAILEKVIPSHLKIIKRLGSGGMATVYEAMDEELGHRVALKVLPLDRSGDRELVNRFKREARLIATLKHPHIVPFYFMETVGQFHFFTMALMEGGNLAPRIGDGMPLNTAINIIRQITGALSHAHGKNIIHRDIKPDNVIFDLKNNAHLADFGIAKGASSTQLTATQVMLGTPAYISPEQIMATEVGPPADIYSLGAMFYHMVTGRVMFPGEELLSAIARHLNETPPRPSTLKPELQVIDPILMKMIAKNPADRFQTAAHLTAELDRCFDFQGHPTPEAIPVPSSLKQSTGMSTPPPIPKPSQQALTQETAFMPKHKGPQNQHQTVLPPSPKPKEKNRKPLFIMAGAAALLLALFLFILMSSKDKDPEPPDAAVTSLPQPSRDNPAEEVAPAPAGDEIIQEALAQFEFTTVPAGPFKMGSRIKFMDDEKPVHHVEISRFMLSRTEVTQALWVAVMGNNPSCNKGEQLPVENVSWNAVQQFLTRLNAATGEQYRLPTEAEWEYGCKAGKTGFLGAILQFRAENQAWYLGNSKHTSRGVGLKDANAFGLYDMLGNVWEWCSDYYDPNYYQDERAKNPTGPTNGTTRVIRGGAWNSDAKEVRPTNRHFFDPAKGDCGVGFRLAK